MGKRGPQRKSSAAQRAAGNPAKRPINEREPEFAPALLEAPDFLEDMARDEWERIAPDLFYTRVVTAMDRAALVGYCRWWARGVEADLAVQKYGAVFTGRTIEKFDPKTNITTKTGGVVYPSPYVNILAQADRMMLQFATHLGITPSSRTAVHTAPEPPESGGKSRFFKVVGA